jgi:hypothetical protein
MAAGCILYWGVVYQQAHENATEGMNLTLAGLVGGRTVGAQSAADLTPPGRHSHFVPADD